MSHADIAIVGAGAAGMAAAIFAGEASAGAHRIVLLDGTRRPGAKILVSGGGRCNVTNRAVTPEDYWGGPSTIVRKVLKAFDEERTREWFESMGVRLKLEASGKYFPESDRASSVLDALLERIRSLDVGLWTQTRVTAISRRERGFELSFQSGEPLQADRVILATGGLALPKSGSDGVGIALARRLGHTIVPTTPALCPLVMDRGVELGRQLTELKGMTLNVRLALRNAAGKVLYTTCDSMVFTHFGLSGPAPMNLSRHWLRARLEQPDEDFTIVLGHPDFSDGKQNDNWLLEKIRSQPNRRVDALLSELYPERLAGLLGEGTTTLGHLTREARKKLAGKLAAMPLPVTDVRGYTFAETTAGGVDLREIDVRSMASRKIEGLHLCGEILDVDGRIGGFNFQWAWATGCLAGRGAVTLLGRQAASRG